MRPVFCGSFDYETRQSDLERLFSKYGTVDRVDMKSGFAFVYFDDERDAEDAIRSLDNTPFGYTKRRLSVEWSRGERGNRRDGSKSAANQRPTKTLFVINFDPIDTRIRDIEKHFEPYGKVLHVRIRRNFAFVQFETQEEATKALECTHMSKICGRVVSVEYALRDDSERGGDRRDSPRRGREDSRSRSRSPVRRRSRPSPDYGRAHSPVYDRYKGPSSNRDRSPDYGRYPSHSPVRRTANGRSPVRHSSASRSPVRRTRSPGGCSPVRRTRSPVRRNRSPVGRSPVRRTRSPVGRSPVRRSPAGGSPNGRSPVRRSPDDCSPV
ncbi:serine/arginine-rich splicing factor RS31-like isoform X2 [Papaver somniferum]|uniref:serine/arginine-rich splicing factor RS31-like isoform X2 n=1 Tax=Papaver somniferum TaxID=3469 RepID=UPI000E6F8B73|nr:serine/arginine-rich splicing factor RS31-like isoform X2 [Papaver somniferum]